jgi:phospholipase/lecithinase/hemolysin
MKTTLLFVLMMLAGRSTLLAGPITTIVAFGDSLSDQGNAFALTGGLFPPPPYAQRASNGPTAVEDLAQQWGVPLAPAATGGTNYAVVGAATGPVLNPATGTFTENISAVEFGLPVLEGTGILSQVGMFLAAPPPFDPASTLFFLWGGANDLLINPSAATALGAATNLGTAIQSLYAAGGRSFLVPNLPDLSLTPSGLALPPLARAQLQALTVGFNTALAARLAALDPLPGIHLTPFDTFSLFAALSANPAAFGFANASDPCLVLSPFSVCAAPDTFVFWDSVHPTAAAHELLGDAFAASVPEPLTTSLFALGLAAAMTSRRRRAL